MQHTGRPLDDSHTDPTEDAILWSLEFGVDYSPDAASDGRALSS